MAITQVPASLLTNILHVEPIGARMKTHTVHLSVSCKRAIEEKIGAGCIAYCASTVVLITGSALSLLVSTIECIATAAIGGLGMILIGCSRDRREWLEKHTLKTLAYSLHSLAIMALSIATMTMGHFDSHTLNVLVDYAAYVGSALLVHSFVGGDIDESSGVTEEQRREASMARITSLLHQALPAFLEDIQDLTGEALLQGLSLAWADDGVRIDLHASPALHQYQTYLQQLIKEAYLEICCTPALAAAFKAPEPEELIPVNGEAEAGCDALDESQPWTFPLLAKWVQLKELQADIQCPDSFASSHAQFNTRRPHLVTAKEHYTALNPAQKELLEKRLLGLEVVPGDAVGLADAQVAAVEIVFKEISELAGSILQGPLVTRSSFTGSVDEGVSYDNASIFQAAMRAAQEDRAR